jgi:ABC-2 type transport system permease protein
MSRTRPLVDDAALVPAHLGGWHSGLGNLFRKELRQWWGTRLWWAQLLTWVVILNGTAAAAMADPVMAPAALVEEAVKTFMLVAATAIGIGAVLTAQGVIVGEKELGTAAWVMSKPVSRPSFVLAKLGALTVGFFVTALLVPAMIYVAEAELLLPHSISYPRLAAGVAVVGLAVLFYLALTVALGTVFAGRGPIAGIGIGLLLAGIFFKGMLPPALVLLTPWTLGDVAGSIALNSAASFDWRLPVVATATWTVSLIGMAIWRFTRDEF